MIAPAHESARPARAVLCALGLFVLLAGCAAGPERLPEFYRTRATFEQPFVAQRPVKNAGLSAAECGKCHVQIYREWQQSVHAQAWSDPQFRAELRKQPGVSWLCINCHTPLVNQLDSLVVRLESGDVERPVKRANPRYDAALREEAITCASCHVRDGAIEGPFHADSLRSPHPVRYNPALRQASFCLRCHQAVQAYPGKNFVCTFNTGKEWEAGPFFSAGVVCQDCHMPAVERALVEGGPVRRVGMHGWIGSHLRKGAETLPALWDSLADARAPGVQLRPDPAPSHATGGRASWSVRVSNANAGHMLPTGDPERAVIVTLAALSPSGDTLAVTQHRIAQRYEWWPEVRKVSDERLAPGAERVLTLSYAEPAGTYVLAARAENERISDANADYHRLPASYPRRVEVARLALSVRPR